MLPEKKYLASGSAPESLTSPRGARFSRVRPSSSGVASSSQSRHSACVAWRSLAAFRRRSSSGWQRNGGWKCGCWRVSPTPGWYDARQAGRINTAFLTDYQRAALARATVEQAIYRIMRSESEMAQPEDGIAAVGGITFASNPPPRLGPAVLEALQGAGLYRRSGSAPPPPKPEVI